MVYCINVSDSRGIPETIYSTWSDNNNYYDVLYSSQDELIQNGFLGSFGHTIYDTHVFSDSDYQKIVSIIQKYFSVNVNPLSNLDKNLKVKWSFDNA